MFNQYNRQDNDLKSQNRRSDKFSLEAHHEMAKFIDVSSDQHISSHYGNKNRHFIEAQFFGASISNLVVALEPKSNQQGIYTIGMTSCDTICAGQLDTDESLSAISMLHLAGGINEWLVVEEEPIDNHNTEERLKAEQKLLDNFDKNKPLYIIIVKGFLESQHKTDDQFLKELTNTRSPIQRRMKTLGFSGQVNVSFCRGSAVAFSKSPIISLQKKALPANRSFKKRCLIM